MSSYLQLVAVFHSNLDAVISFSYIIAMSKTSCLFNLYAEYIVRNAGLEEAQAGIKIARRNINNLRYADDILWQKAK